MTKKQYYTALLIMEPAMAVIAVVICLLTGKPMLSWYVSSSPVLFQAAIGAAAAVPLAALITIAGLKISFFSDLRDMFGKLFISAKLNTFDILITSVLAGFFEEILFRGVIQPYLGIGITSFIFILIHGYFNPKSLNMTVSGIAAFGVSCLIGLFFERFGFVSAAVFHAAYDFTALYIMMKHFGRKPETA